MGAGIKVTRKKSKSGASAIKVMERMAKQMQASRGLAVGLPSGSMDYPDGTSVIEVAVINEFGINTAERPFLREGFRQNKTDWLKLNRKIWAKVLKNGYDPKAALGMLGEKMQFDIQASLDEGAWEPNTGAYGEWKASKGKTKPLILTGHLRSSIRWVNKEDNKQ